MRMLKVDDETYQKVCKLAEKSHTSRADFIHEVVAAKGEYEAWKLKEVKTGLADIDAGRVVSSSDMKDFVGELIKSYK